MAVNTVANQPLAGPLLTTDYLLVYQGAQSPPTRKLPASALDELYAGLNGQNTFTDKQTISSGGISVTGNSSITGTLSLSSSFVVSSGGITVNNGGGVFDNVGGWSSSNYGKQLLVQRTTGSNNPAIGVTDKDGTNLWALANNAGTFLIASMPAYSDSTTAPTNVVSLTKTGASVTGTLTSSGKLTVSSGGATVTAGGITVTAGGLTVSAGATNLLGNVSIGGNVTSATTFTSTIDITGSGNTTVSSAGQYTNLAANYGVSGATTYGLKSTFSIIGSTLYATSDARAKRDVRKIGVEEAWHWIDRARPVTFEMDGMASAGFIAQDDIRAGRVVGISFVPDARDAFAESDGFAPAGHKLVKSYENEIAYCVATLQDLHRRVKTLETKGLFW